MANVRIFRAGLLAAVGLAGCSSEPLRPAGGRVSLSGGDVAVLAGSTVEIALESDPTVRASGTIEPDGRFNLDTLQNGAVRRGAPEGAYKARIILGDDDPALQKKAAKANQVTRISTVITTALPTSTPSAWPIDSIVFRWAA